MKTRPSRWFTWSPDADTLAALITEGIMIGAYWTATHRNVVGHLVDPVGGNRIQGVEAR